MKVKAFVVFVILLATLTAVMFTRREGRLNSSQQALGSSASSQEKHVATVLCDGFDIRPDAHVGDKVVSAGFSGNANAVREAALEEAKHNTVMLKLLWNASRLGEGNAIGNEGDLVDGSNCLTQEARQRWYQLKGAIMSAQVVNEPAPAGGMNTGANGSGAYQSAGVADEGDGRMATRVTYQNGKSVWILHRCGNVVVEGTIPGVPEKPREPENGGKDARTDVLVNPDVPDQVKGCGAAGCGGNTAGSAYQPPPAPPPAPPAPPPATTAPRPLPTYSNPVPTSGTGTGP